MLFVRRLVNLCLTLAFAGYGLIAAAPAHAHGDIDHHGIAVHAIAWDAGPVDDHHIDGAQRSAHHGDDLSGNETTPADHDDLHVHAVAAFTTVSEPSVDPQLISATVVTWAERPTGLGSSLFSPLKKPPRLFL